MSNIKTKIKNLIQNLKQVFLRFPLAGFFALVLSILLSYLFVQDIVNAQYLNHEELFLSICCGCGIAILLAFAADLFCHLRNASLKQRIWCNIAGVLASAVFTWLVFQCNSSFSEYYVFTTLFVTLLLMLIWPTWGQHNIKITWNYHIRLVYAIAITCIMAFILVIGIIAILLSIYFLFNIKIADIIAVFIAVTIALFSPCCAMALMPINKDYYEKPLSYSKFLKVLVLFILLPLVCIEAIVLYIYAITILVSWQLPEGGVAYWVFSYAIAASIVWYLLMPVFHSEQPSKLKILDRGFFISLIPLLVLLFVGLFRRIHDYGFTTNRYIVLAIAIWFLVISLIMIFRKSRNITPLLCSLVIISFLALVGPWSMFSLPKSMQIKRFEKIANEYNLLENGKITSSAVPLSREQNIALSELIDFFMDTKEYRQDFAEQYFGIAHAETDYIIDNSTCYDLKELLMYMMNGEYISEYSRRITDDEGASIEENQYYTFSNEKKQFYDITLYDFAFVFDREDEFHGHFKNDNVEINMHKDPKRQDLLLFYINNYSFEINIIDSLKLSNYCYRENSCQTLSNNQIVHEDDHVKLYMDINYIGLYKNSTGSFSIDDISFNGFVKLKN